MTSIVFMFLMDAALVLITLSLDLSLDLFTLTPSSGLQYVAHYTVEITSINESRSPLYLLSKLAHTLILAPTAIGNPDLSIGEV